MIKACVFVSLAQEGVDVFANSLVGDDSVETIYKLARPFEGCTLVVVVKGEDRNKLSEFVMKKIVYQPGVRFTNTRYISE